MLTAFASVMLLAAPPAFGPFGSPRHPVTSDVRAAPAKRAAADETFFRVAFEFYRHVVSAIDGPTCPHRPTCSLYGLRAVRRHGLVGMWLTIDRLLRGPSSSVWRTLPIVTIDGHTFFSDPLEESTFWFSPSPR